MAYPVRFRSSQSALAPEWWKRTEKILPNDSMGLASMQCLWVITEMWRWRRRPQQWQFTGTRYNSSKSVDVNACRRVLSVSMTLLFIKIRKKNMKSNRDIGRAHRADKFFFLSLSSSVCALLLFFYSVIFFWFCGLFFFSFESHKLRHTPVQINKRS